MVKPRMSKDEFIAHLHLIGMKGNGFAHKPYKKRWHRLVGDNVIMVDFDAMYPTTARCHVSLNGWGKKAGSYAKAWQLINDAINEEGVWRRISVRENLSPPS